MEHNDVGRTIPMIELHDNNNIKSIVTQLYSIPFVPLIPHFENFQRKMKNIYLKYLLDMVIIHTHSFRHSQVF